MLAWDNLSSPLLRPREPAPLAPEDALTVWRTVTVIIIIDKVLVDALLAKCFHIGS